MSYRGYRGRGRFQPRSVNPESFKLLEGLSSQVLCTLAAPSSLLHTGGKDTVEATDVVTLGSYNWVEHSVPTIIVPGSPSLWKEPELPLQLEPDSGPSFIDQNAARLPKSPLEPMLRAVSVAQKSAVNEFDLADEAIDIVTDRNNLRKLMRFVCANGPNQDPRMHRSREFRIDAQLAPNGRTLILTRRGEKNVDDSTGFKGYGRNFEREATKAHSPLVAVNQNRTVVSRLKFCGYHRIIRYDLLDLRFMVRFEVDAMADPSPSLVEAPKNPSQVDALAELFASTSISQSAPAPAPLAPRSLPTKPAEVIDVEGSELRHVLHGELVPQESLIELTSLAGKYNVTWSDIYPQLFLSQTPILKVAKHFNGKVDSIETYTNDDDAMMKAHSDLSQDFRALVLLLTQMRTIASENKGAGKALAFYWSGTGDLQVRSVECRDGLLGMKELEIF